MGLAGAVLPMYDRPQLKCYCFHLFGQFGDFLPSIPPNLCIMCVKVRDLQRSSVVILIFSRFLNEATRLVFMRSFYHRYSLSLRPFSLPNHFHFSHQFSTVIYFDGTESLGWINHLYRSFPIDFRSLVSNSISVGCLRCHIQLHRRSIFAKSECLIKNKSLVQSSNFRRNLLRIHSE